ncbi:hypothetical protein HDU91_004056, partial [Kappamyces sp. JEL0680]
IALGLFDVQEMDAANTNQKPNKHDDSEVVASKTRVFLAGFGTRLPGNVKCVGDALEVFTNGAVKLSSLEHYRTKRVWGKDDL